ncbi:MULTISPECIES: hypothetical protein, partial [unclassified Streptomyces]|uniref:hypothetical protein n=1 Tax=unclassified Streptomyces TaxID=2593676 RepID=UPI0033ADFD26
VHRGDEIGLRAVGPLTGRDGQRVLVRVRTQQRAASGETKSATLLLPSVASGNNVPLFGQARAARLAAELAS